ncbi:Protein arginine N-methyltransferase 7 [Ancistrocladus abbreviatus]
MASIIPKTLTPYFSFPLKLNRRLSSFPRSNPRATRAMSTKSSQQIFQLKLDPLTGNSEWIIIDENDDTSHDSAKPDLATTSYLDMLNDTRRNRAFRDAIDKAITKPCHVLDIGAGTGLLSMMAVRAMGLDDQTIPGGNKGMVTACESFLPMVKLMRKVLRLNDMEKKINVVYKWSDELKVGVDINSRADALVSEILDSELLGEGLLPTLQNAYDTLLVENPQTVPYRVTTYGQLVESAFLWTLHDLYNNETNASDGIHLVPTGLDKILRVKPRQYPMHCDPLKDEIKLLSEPFKIFEFEFWKRPESHRETDVVIKAFDDGRVNAIVSWWVLQLDCEGTIFYSTAPEWIKESQPQFSGAGNWCDHWKQCVWFVPGKGVPVLKDEEVHLHANHSEISISYSLKAQTPQSESCYCKLEDGDFHLALSPERIAIYGAIEWRNCMLSAVQKAVQEKDSPLCVVADDSVFLATLIASLSKSSHIISLFPGLREKGSKYLQAIAEANGFSLDCMEIFDHRKDWLTIYDAHQKKVDLLVGEPFYYGHDGRLPWQNLRFWKDRTVLDGILSKDARIIPCKAVLKACAMFLPDLWRSRCSLGEIGGFDHSVANPVLGACGDLPPPQEGRCLPFFVWQCGQTKVLSKSFTIMEFDFLELMNSCSGAAKVEFSEPGICHGFVLWIDWVMDPENSVTVSTGPDNRYWKQGVKLLSEPVAVQPAGLMDSDGKYKSVEIEACFDSSNGDVVIRHTFV